MADSKLSALSTIGTLDVADLLYVVDDPSGSPLSRKTTVGSLGGVVNLSGTYASLPAASTAGRLYYPTDSIYTVLRDNGSSWDHFIDGQQATPPVSGDFSWVNQGSATVDTTYGGVYLEAPVSASANLRCRVKSAPSAPYTITAWFRTFFVIGTQAAGLCFRQSSDGKIHVFWVLHSNSNSMYLISAKYSSATAYSADYTARQVGTRPGSMWLRIADDNSNRICSYSIDGQHWIVFDTQTRTNYLTADQVGFLVDEETNTLKAGMMLASWKEA